MRGWHKDHRDSGGLGLGLRDRRTLLYGAGMFSRNQKTMKSAS